MMQTHIVPPPSWRRRHQRWSVEPLECCLCHQELQTNEKVIYSTGGGAVTLFIHARHIERPFVVSKDEQDARPVGAEISDAAVETCHP